jgi:hypothetical protein
MREAPDLEAIRRNVATKEPEILRRIGEESVRNGTDKLSSEQINATIREARRIQREKTR